MSAVVSVADSKGRMVRTFTDQTWEPFAQTGLTARSSQEHPELDYWMHRHDLAVQLAADGKIPFEWANTAVAAVLSGLPVTITRNVIRGSVTETVIIKQIFKGSSHFYYRSWGHAGVIYWRDVWGLDTPKSTYDLG